MIESIQEFPNPLTVNEPRHLPTSFLGDFQKKASILAHQLFQDLGSLFNKIIPPLKERLTWIRNQKESYQFLAQASTETEPFFEDPASRNISPDSLQIPSQSGVSGSYFLIDKDNVYRFIIKPNDEDCGCLHNPHGYSSFGMESPIRENMPLYQSALKEALTYELAENLGLSSIAPKTILAILKSEGFSRFLTDTPSSKSTKSSSFSSCIFTLTNSSKLAFWHLLSKIQNLFYAFHTNYLNTFTPYWLKKNDIIMDAEKLCSVQTFIPNAQPLGTIEKLTANKGSIDPDQFEDCNILIWITGDTDAHAYNILSCPISTDDNGITTYAIKKIDNGLTFPTKNTGLRNCLAYYPQMENPLSSQGKEKIKTIDISSIAEKMRLYGIVDSIPAMEERIALLKKLCEQETITLQKINASLHEMSTQTQQDEKSSENTLPTFSPYNIDSIPREYIHEARA